MITDHVAQVLLIGNTNVKGRLGNNEGETLQFLKIQRRNKGIIYFPHQSG